MATTLSANDEANLLQTIEMFEVITQSQPQDYQSLEILKEAYFKLGRQQAVVATSKRIAQAYLQLGQLSSATLEYESVLQLFPDDPDVRKALAELEHRTTCLTLPPPTPNIAMSEKSRPSAPKPAGAGSRQSHPEIDDGRQAMLKLLVDGKFISTIDFDRYWPRPSLNAAPAKAVEPFIQVLADQGILPLEKSLKLLCDRTRMCYLPVDKYDVDVELTRSFSRDACLRWCVLPFDRMSKSVLVATANPFNRQAASELEGASRNRLLWFLGSPSELIKALGKAFR